MPFPAIYKIIYPITDRLWEKCPPNSPFSRKFRKITSTCSKMAIFIPTSMKLGRHMYPYTWQLSAKFGKIVNMSAQSYRQKWWIYYALRNSAFNACNTLRGDNNGVKLTAMKCPFEWYQVWYMFTQKIVSKSHLNKGHYTNSAEFPPDYNTYRLWRHFFQTAFRP